MELSDHSRLEDEAFDALPPPLSPGHDQGDPFGDGGEDGEVSRLADVPEAKRKGVKRPQPKLDSNRLISERGLPALRTLFNHVHFKGKGHEVEDLRLLMQKMENWAHRLYPKLQFEDFIDKLEKLGSKKEVQTCLKRIRLDMPLTHEDFTVNEGEEEPVPEVPIFGDPDPFGGEHLRNSPPRLVHSTPAPSATPVPSSPPSLTEDQRKRMEFNRVKALERRLARQLQEPESKPDPAQGSINVSTEKTPSHSQDQEETTEKTPSHSQDQEEATEKTPSHSQDQEEATEKTPSHSQDQEEVPDFDQDSLSSSTQHNSQPLSQDSQVESTQAHKPQTSPSPVHDPDNICKEEE